MQNSALKEEFADELVAERASEFCDEDLLLGMRKPRWMIMPLSSTTIEGRRLSESHSCRDFRLPASLAWYDCQLIACSERVLTYLVDDLLGGHHSEMACGAALNSKEGAM